MSQTFELKKPRRYLYEATRKAPQSTLEGNRYAEELHL